MSEVEPVTKGKMARTAIVVAATAAMLGIIYGYDNGVVGGAQLFFANDLELSTQQTEFVVTAIVYGEVIGAILGGLLINRIGRKKSMLLLTSGYVVFGILSGLATNMAFLAGARFGLGLAIGVSLIAVPVFVAESVPARVRGGTLVLYQVMGVCGIILGLLFSLALSETTAGWNWRVMLALAALPALLLLPVIARLPESARWLVMKGRSDEARESLNKVDPEADHDQEIKDMEEANASESGGTFKEMLRPPYRRATIFVVVLGFFIQITGINATVTYGPQIFKAMGIESDRQNILMALLVQCFALLAVLTSMRYIDRWGRRPILLTGIGIMIVAQIIMVVTFATQEGDKLVGWQIAAGFAGLALINIGFVFGFGSLVWVYSSEAFPARLRAYGSSAMLTSDLIANVIIAQFFLTVMATIGGAGSFGIFAVLAVIAWLFVFKMAPETKGKDLDDIRHFWENGGEWPSDVAGSTAGSVKTKEN